MALDAKHPLYMEGRDDRQLMTDAYAGERVVKSKTTIYLPYCASHILDGVATVTQLGSLNYLSYLTRAVFPDYVKEAVQKAIGMMHQKDAVIVLPKEMEPLRKSATLRGESLIQLLRRINEEQLVQGRLGILADLPNQVNLKTLPYIALYKENAIINWDNSSTTPDSGMVNFVVLDETSDEIQPSLEWKSIEKYRVLNLSTVSNTSTDIFANAPKVDGQEAVYMTAQYRETKTYDITQLKAPTLRGASLNEIPFVFINTNDNNPEPSDSPLLGLGRLSMSIYRGEADYRYNLFMQGQDTFVTIGEEITEGELTDPTQGTIPTRVGAGARISMELGGDAKYVGVGSEGLQEQRQAIQNDRKLAATKTVEIGKESGEVESGNSRKIRISAETASLISIALSGATGLERLLKSIARWMGVDESVIKVIPNLEFASAEIDGQMIVNMTTAKMQGFPVSLRSMHSYAKERGMTRMTYEEELNEISKEEPLVDPDLTGTGVQP